MTEFDYIGLQIIVNGSKRSGILEIVSQGYLQGNDSRADQDLALENGSVVTARVFQNGQSKELEV